MLVQMSCPVPRHLSIFLTAVHSVMYCLSSRESESEITLTDFYQQGGHLYLLLLFLYLENRGYM